MEKAKKFWCYRRQGNKSLLQVSGLCVLPKFSVRRNFSQEFTEPSMETPCSLLTCDQAILFCIESDESIQKRIAWSQVMLVYIRGTPIWRPPENSVNIWNLLWLSRRLIISTEQTSIYVSPFPNNLTSEKARNHEISIFFWTNSIIDLCHAPP